jgi:hypothetical protein
MTDEIARAIGIPAVFLITAYMMKTYLSHREKMKGFSITKLGRTASDDRLARVEQAVEAIAIEIERVSEGQRYVTKLLNERAQPMIEGVAAPVPMQVQARRVDTPH